MTLNDEKYLNKELQKLQKMYQLKKYNDVIIKSKILIKKFPNIIPFYNAIGLSFKELGNYNEGKNYLLKGLEINGDEVNLLSNLGLILKDEKKYEEAEKIFLKAISINKQNIIVLINYGNLKKEMKQFEKAIDLYNRALNINSNSYEVHLNLADTYKILGKFKLCLKHCSFLNSNYPEIIKTDQIMSEILDYSQDRDHQSLMNKKLKEPNLSLDNKIILNFTLAKSYEDQREFKKSIQYYDSGNNLKYSSFEDYNFKKEKVFFENIKNNFLKLKNKIKKTEDYEKKIIFILGLPRSGTTLIHQILSQNQETFGAGEMVFFNDHLKEFGSEDLDENTYFKKIIEIRASFAKRLNLIENNKDIILEKTPDNFIWLGFLKLIFPNCKIINCQRNLKDVGLSLYKKLFLNKSYIWSYNKSTLIQYLDLYKEIIEFWKLHFDKEIFDNNYSDLIEDPKIQSKKIFEFCDISWKDEFLKIENSNKPIETLSYVQARKPIYKTGIDSYKNFQGFTNLIENIK